MWAKILGLGWVLAAFFFSQSLFAYQRVELHPDDLRTIQDPDREAEFRLFLIDQAQDSIDIVTFDQRADDEVGKPLLLALRRAAERNVRVRFIRGGWVSKLYSQYYAEPSLFDPVMGFLNSPLPHRKIEYQFFGGLSLVMRGWSGFTGIHEKLLVVDKKISLVTGRGQGSVYSDWLDSCYVFKGRWVAESVAKFKNLWDTVVLINGSGESSTVARNNRSHSAPAILTEPDSVGKEPSDQKLEKLKRWAMRPAQDPATVPAEERLVGGILHHDLIAQLQSKCSMFWFYSYSACAEEIKDPVVSELLQLISQAEEIKFYTLGIILHDQVRAALLARLQEKSNGGRDFRLTILTNGKEAHRVVVPVPMAWWAGLRDTNALLQAGARIFAFKEIQGSRYEYLHRKSFMAIFPDGKKVLVFGSHNFNVASTYVNDEMSFIVEGGKVIDQELRRFERSLQHADELDPATIQAEENANTLIYGFDWLWRAALNLSEGLI